MSKLVLPWKDNKVIKKKSNEYVNGYRKANKFLKESMKN